MFLQRHKIKENWNPEFLSSCEAEEFNNFQSIIFKDKQDFNKRKYLAFEKTWKLLSTMDCPVFVTGGTLLGIIRDNKLIDWDDDYYWRVRPIDADGNVGDWVNTFTFEIF